MKLMTFLSDFGTKSSYVSQMKAVASSITDAQIIDITHEVTPYNIREGAFLLMTAVPYFPSGTVHVAVVDPGVGTSRKGIVVTTRTQILVGPDNGLLIPAAKNLGEFIVYEIANPKITLDFISNTFHGRDVFAPVAAHILNGLRFDDIGPVTNNFSSLNFGICEINDKSASGKVIYVDCFGNVITNINGLLLNRYLSYGKNISIVVEKKHFEIPFVKSYNFVKKGETLSTIGSSNFLEIALSQGNATKKLGIKIGDEIKIMFV